MDDAGPGPEQPEVSDEAAIEARARALLAELTPDEKVACLSGDGPALRGSLEMARRYNEEPIVAGAVPRLGVLGVRFTDGPRGIVMHRSTAFPVAMARGATFDPDLEERVGGACGLEARAQGANLFAGVCINVLRHPAWGRAQETYGEDVHHLGEMGAALVRGAQRHVMACVKHFTANSMENSRFWVDVRIDDATLRDVYLPHFRRCVEAGAASVMSAYNRVNGQWCGHHTRLLADVLKEEWGFDGFVMSDFTFGVRSPDAVAAGQDLEMPFRWRFRRLRRHLRQGRIAWARVDDAVLRLLRQQLRLAARTDGQEVPGRDVVAGSEHRALAREVSVKSIVLLRNEPRPAPSDGGVAAPVLPLDPDRVHRIALIGGLADRANTGDLGSSLVRAPEVVTIRAGLEAAAARRGTAVTYHPGAGPGGAEAAAEADVAVVVVGYTYRDEGEWIGRAGGDRSQLGLRPSDVRLVHAVASANPRTVVVLMGGSAIVTEGWRERVAALVMAWYPGMEGGHAVADVLFGDASPGGRLPSTWPRSAADLPPFRRFTRRIRYGPRHGYRLLEADGTSAAFPFGFGLGYTETALSPPRLVQPPGPDRPHTVVVEVDVANQGARPGVEVIQAYVPEVLGQDTRALRTLRAFQRVEVDAGEQATARLAVPLPPSASSVWVGPSSAPADLVEVDVRSGPLGGAA